MCVCVRVCVCVCVYVCVCESELCCGLWSIDYIPKQAYVTFRHVTLGGEKRDSKDKETGHTTMRGESATV
jgi:hypothetical protein